MKKKETKLQENDLMLCQIIHTSNRFYFVDIEQHESCCYSCPQVTFLIKII